jgi:F-box/TPR repeat protein Pof3
MLEIELIFMPQALKCPDVDALPVLDNRAATYTKLLRYDQALKDSRQMIKHNKQDERVHLSVSSMTLCADHL